MICGGLPNEKIDDWDGFGEESCVEYSKAHRAKYSRWSQTQGPWCRRHVENLRVLGEDRWGN